MTSDALALPLLEFLQYKAGCTYLSDLRCLDGWQRARLARVVEQIPMEAASIHDWDDALDYLAETGPEHTAEDARARLIAALGVEHQPKVKDTKTQEERTK